MYCAGGSEYSVKSGVACVALLVGITVKQSDGCSTSGVAAIEIAPLVKSNVEASRPARGPGGETSPGKVAAHFYHLLPSGSLASGSSMRDGGK